MKKYIFSLAIILVSAMCFSCGSIQGAAGIVHDQTQCEVTLKNSTDEVVEFQVFALYGKTAVLEKTVQPGVETLAGNVDHSGFGNAYRVEANGEVLQRFDTRPGIRIVVEAKAIEQANTTNKKRKRAGLNPKATLIFSPFLNHIFMSFEKTGLFRGNPEARNTNSLRLADPENPGTPMRDAATDVAIGSATAATGIVYQGKDGTAKTILFSEAAIVSDPYAVRDAIFEETRRHEVDGIVRVKVNGTNLEVDHVGAGILSKVLIDGSPVGTFVRSTP